jgi:hypothetical protein
MRRILSFRETSVQQLLRTGTRANELGFAGNERSPISHAIDVNLINIAGRKFTNYGPHVMVNFQTVRYCNGTAKLIVNTRLKKNTAQQRFLQPPTLRLIRSSLTSLSRPLLPILTSWHVWWQDGFPTLYYCLHRKAANLEPLLSPKTDTKQTWAR